MKHVFMLTVVLIVTITKTTYAATVTSDPNSLMVIGSLGPIKESLLTYQPPIKALLVPLSSRHLQIIDPPRLFVASESLTSQLAARNANTPSNNYLPPTPKLRSTALRENLGSKRSKPELKFRTINQGFPVNFNFGEEEGKSAVDQLQAYSRPVSIPSSGRALFSSMDASDGSYHFGYDTGAGQHQSYREERRLPGGRVEGRYGYVDPEGVLRIVEYTADQRGYRSRVTTRNPSIGPPIIGPIPPPLIAKARKAAASANAASFR